MMIYSIYILIWSQNVRLLCSPAIILATSPFPFRVAEFGARFPLFWIWAVKIYDSLCIFYWDFSFTNIFKSFYAFFLSSPDTLLYYASVFSSLLNMGIILCELFGPLVDHVAKLC